MNYNEKTIKDFIQVLSSKEPVPGGGGASALIGSIGIALGNMVGSLTVGKKKYADVEEDIKILMFKAERLAEKFQELIDKDAESFAPLALAYALPKDTEEEKAERTRVMEAALETASLAPLEIMETVCEAVDIVSEFAAKGSKLAISDAGVAAIALRSALLGASLNVFINTASMQNRSLAAELEGRANEMIEEYGAKAEKIFNSVKERL
ncbi:MAG: cyclodeaminase/cyclohydrolase family protein [Lachnospiraceae bacterium]|nr:cyclodeaminase/cyclohydrolase family protein [Lachnospiraceae bacterium]